MVYASRSVCVPNIVSVILTPSPDIRPDFCCQLHWTSAAINQSIIYFQSEPIEIALFHVRKHMHHQGIVLPTSPFNF